MEGRRLSGLQPELHAQPLETECLIPLFLNPSAEILFSMESLSWF